MEKKDEGQTAAQRVVNLEMLEQRRREFTEVNSMLISRRANLFMVAPVQMNVTTGEMQMQEPWKTQYEELERADWQYLIHKFPELLQTQ